jgi:hypothetical protein
MSDTGINAGASAGGGFCSMLTVAFIVLKLVGTITWSWWWVLSPLWIPLALGIVLGIIFVAVASIRG